MRYIWRLLHDNTLKVTVVLVPAKPEQYKKNESDYNFLNAIHEVSDHHLHHEWQGLAAIMPPNFM
jgi:hypothetical protein